MMSVKYPDVTVRLVGNDGNAFAVLGAVKRALRVAGVPAGEIQEYLSEAMAGDYDDLLRVTMRTVVVE